jgi:serine/threonine-protein kinase ATR
MTQTHTLPWMVMMKRQDIIQRISHARGDDDPMKTCLDNANLAAILSILLIQQVPDLESYTMQLFRGISSHFNNLELVDLLKMEPIMLAFELLKAGGEADDSNRKSRVSGFISYEKNVFVC